MKPLLGLLFLIVNIYAASMGLSNILILIILAGIILCYLYVSRIQGNSLLITLIELLCYTWSSSWRNIFGGSFEDIPIPWFYLIGLIIVIYILFNKRLILPNITILLLYLLIIVGTVPLITANDFYEGLTEYITLLFFFIVIGVTLNAKMSITEKEYFNVLSSLIYASLFSCIGIIIQFITQRFFGINLINNQEAELLGGSRLINNFLFDDISSATICLGLPIIIILLNVNKFKHSYLIAFIIITGMTLSSARTGFITLMLTLIIYLIVEKNSVNKIRITFMLSAAIIIGGIAYFFVRDISSMNELLNDNGRFIGYKLGIELWLGEPIFGIGFGDAYLSHIMNMPIPHFSLLNILTQTGIIYFLLLLTLLIIFYRISLQSAYKYGKYMFIHSILGSFFVPGLFSARFFTIVIIVIILQKKIEFNK